MTGGQRNTIEVLKTPEGNFRASVMNTNIKIEPVEDSKRDIAVRLLTDKLNQAYVRGEIE